MKSNHARIGGDGAFETAQIQELARLSEKIVLVSGNFNIIHPGHLRLLKFASEVGDFVVVGITPDGSRDVSVPAEMRLEAMQAISLVDYAVILSEPVESFILRLRPHLVVKGKEHENQQNSEESAVASYGGQLLFSSGETLFSSLDLLRHEYVGSPAGSAVIPMDYLRRNQIGAKELHAALRKIAGMRILVIGDLIIDEYISCDPLGMSQEDPTIVVMPIETKSFIGGAGIVGAHAKGLGANVRFVTLIGEDESADFAREQLAAYGVEMLAFADDTRPTPKKQRFRAMGKTLLRVNQLRQHAVAPAIAAAMIETVEALLEETDLLLFADFNYGCLPQSVVDEISAAARRRGIMMAADSQASSQMSDISRYVGARLITPTEREARLALLDSDSGLVVLAQKLQQKTGAENVLLTLGAEGLLMHARDGGEFRTDRLPALNTAPKDLAGAGDSLFATTAMAVCAGVDIWCSAYLGSLAAACQVSRVGNTPLTVREMIAQIGRHQEARIV
jgi:rfaE bifunctional protein kinase chain/domain